MKLLRHDTATDHRGGSEDPRTSGQPGGSNLFWTAKRVGDVATAIALLPLFAITALVILALNPILNPGPLFYVQTRMGRYCKPFATFKFRTMTDTKSRPRLHDAPLEVDRITPLGAFMRKARIDEIPQVINILKGEMSLIGPRPDFFGHARVYVRAIPEYRDRHRIRPGISGLAQVELGYAEGVEATREKTRLDLIYIEKAGFRMDLVLLWRTALTVVRGLGR